MDRRLVVRNLFQHGKAFNSFDLFNFCSFVTLRCGLLNGSLKFLEITSEPLRVILRYALNEYTVFGNVEWNWIDALYDGVKLAY